MRYLSRLIILSSGLILGAVSGCPSESPEPPRAVEPPALPDTVQSTPETRPPSPTPTQDASSPDLATSRQPDPTGQILAEAITALRPTQVLEIESLLAKGDVRELTGFTEALNVYPLEGQPPNETYNALRIGPGDQFGVGLQVWKYGSSAEAASQYVRLGDTYVATRDAGRIVGDRSFRSDFGGIRQLVFMSRRTHHVVAVSCDQVFCPENDSIEALAELVRSRL